MLDYLLYVPRLVNAGLLGEKHAHEGSPLKKKKLQCRDESNILQRDDIFIKTESVKQSECDAFNATTRILTELKSLKKLQYTNEWLLENQIYL